METNKGEYIVSIIPEQPITSERPPPDAAMLEQVLGDAGQPRANMAPTLERPKPPVTNLKRTVLQQHCDFFDAGEKGYITPGNTYTGFRRIGFSALFSAAAAVVVNGAFSYPTVKGWTPDPLFRIYTERIHKTKHGSDSESYDTEGRYVPQKLEEVFSKHGAGDGKLTLRDVLEVARGQRRLADPFGWIASVLEWVTTWLLLADDEGKLHKESVRGVLDGSVFYKLAESKERRAREAKAAKYN